MTPMSDGEMDAVLRLAGARRRLPPPAARRQLRERAGLSQETVGNALGVTREAVARWELGERTPRPATALAYLELLDRLAREAMR
jgi:transcriptional regulator with XRE-family HTH domain